MLELIERRWFFVLFGSLINVCLGTVYSWSVFVDPLLIYFSTPGNSTVTASSIYLPFSVFLAFLSIAMFCAGKYIDSYGPRPVAIVGGVLAGLGWLLASFSPSPLVLALTYGIIGGFGAGLTYSVPLVISARWFPDRQGLAIGLTVLGFGLSTLFTANIASLLINAYGVMNTFRAEGLTIMILVVLFALPLRFPPEGRVPQPLNPQKTLDLSKQKTCEMTVTQMMKTSTFYGLWMCYFIGCLIGLMAIGISQPVGTAIGINGAVATTLVGGFAVCNSVGRPAFGLLTDKLTPQKTAVIAFALMASASLLCSVVPSPMVYIFSFAMFWGCFGGWLTIAPTACGKFFGMRNYSRCYGVIYLAFGAGGFVGPQLAGFIKATTGSYIAVFPYILLLTCIGLICAIALLKQPTDNYQSG